MQRLQTTGSGVDRGVGQTPRISSQEWEDQRERFTNLYLNKTLEETMGIMEQTYGFSATKRQYKKKISEWHLDKNVKEAEMKAMIRKQQKRKLREGKDSSFRLRGRPIPTRKLERFAKQRADESESVIADISCYTPPIKSPFSHRTPINAEFIAIPLSSAQSPNSSADLALPPVQPSSSAELQISLAEDNEEIIRLESPFLAARIPLARTEILPQTLLPAGTSPAIQGDNFDLPVNIDEFRNDETSAFWFDIEELQQNEWIPQDTTNQIRTERLIRDNESPVETTANPNQANVVNSPISSNRQLRFTFNLPWFRLQDLFQHNSKDWHHILSRSLADMKGATLSPLMTDQFDSALSLLSSAYPSSPLLALERYKVPVKELENVLTGLLGPSFGPQAGDIVPSFVFKFRNIVPQRHSAELPTQPERLFDTYDKYPLRQLFQVTAYFSSNNMLSTDQMAVFVQWVINQNYVEHLKLFLQIDTPSIRGFATKVMDGGIHLQDVNFLEQLHGIGVEFDDFVDQLMGVGSISFLHQVLSIVDRTRLSGASGGRILWALAGTPHVALAEILVQAGADVDCTNSNSDDKITSTCLWQAIHSKNLDMVKFLVRAGASLSRLSKADPPSPLAKAVSMKHCDIVTFLLEHGADTNVTIDDTPIFNWAFNYCNDVYEILTMNVSEYLNPVIKAASASPHRLSQFLQHNSVSQEVLQRALSESLRTGQTKAVINFLQWGVDPNGPCIPEAELRPLRIAIRQPDSFQLSLKYVDLLIKAGANVNVDDDDVLSDAVLISNFDEDIVESLIDAGADLENYGEGALVSATISDNLEAIALLLDRGVPVNAYLSPLVLTCLQIAADWGKVSLARYLISRGADVNVPASDSGGRTALQCAAQSGWVDMARLLIDLRADINAPPALTQGVTALEASVRVGEECWMSKDDRAELFILLLGHGASVNRPDGKRSNLLHDLIERGFGVCLRLALEAGAHMHYMSRGVRKRTPLQLAAEKGRFDFVKLLVVHGADVNAAPAYKHGRTALQAAASSEVSDLEMVNYLLEKGADINTSAAVIGGITALQGAAIMGHINIALMLIEKGADVNSLPAVKDGRTAIEGAAEHGRLDMVQMLLNAGSRGDVYGNVGFKRAIELAEGNRHFAVAKLLREHEQTANVLSI